jgi:flavin reductase (DIM6/NTAB) family NADH-FMN oxidoreductase RutF
MEESDTSDVFESATPLDGKALLHPSVLLLIISSSEKHGVNMMTAGWWTAVGYNPLRFLLVVEKKTHTYDVIRENKEFVMAVPSVELVEAVILSGMVSGAELDKIKHLGLKLLDAEVVDVPLLQQAVGNIECSVLQTFEVEDADYHVGTVEAAHIRPGALEGRIVTPESRILANLGSDWKNPGDRMKHRYYLNLAGSMYDSYGGEAVLDDLPTELQEKYDN